MTPRDIMLEHGFTLEDLARITGYSAYSCRKYIHGERGMRNAHEHTLVEEYGAPGRILVEAMREKRRAYLETHPLAPRSAGRHGKRVAIPKPLVVTKPKPRRSTRDAVNRPDDDWDGKLYTITEWRRLFGEPGNSQGANARVEGVFPTEPCYLGE